MTLKREPGPFPPFEMVLDENGHTHMQCTRCGDNAYLYDHLAMRMIRSSRFGNIRLAILRPWAVAGLMRFAWRNIHCIEASR